MKKIYISIILIICCISLLTFLIRHIQNNFSQKLNTNKTSSYKLKPVVADQEEEEDLVKSVESNFSESEHPNEQEMKDASEDALLSTSESSVGEESAFSEQISLMKGETPDKTEEDALESETEDSKEPENIIQELTQQEQNQIIDKFFPLISVLADYGVDISVGGVRCPLCGHPDDFIITRDGNTWWCETCSNTSHDTIEFVAKVKSISRNEARKFLIKKAGY